MVMFLKKIEDNALYLYLNGNLIYKRWLDTGQSKVFDVMAYDKYNTTSIRALEFENPDGLISIKAKLKLYATAEGGRKTGIISGYRPNHVFEYPKNEEMLQAFVGDIVFDEDTLEPGEERIVTVRFRLHQPIDQYLVPGNAWWIHEGTRVIGEVVVMQGNDSF